MQSIELSKLRTDGGTQARETINNDVVREYLAAWAAGDNFPPIDVFYDGATYWIADGFHRYYGARDAKQKTIFCTVHNGTVRDAILFAVGANRTNGLRRTNADKRRAVQILLEDEEWVTWSDREIAEKAGVSQPFVGEIRRQLITVISSPAAQSSDKPRKGKDGKTRKQPKRKAKPQPPKDDDPPALAVIRNLREPEPEAESTVFVRLRALFDEMEEWQRPVAGGMWAEWICDTE